VKIYLVNVDSGRRVFCSDGLDAEEEEVRPRFWGFLGWCEERLRRFRASILHAEGGLALRARRSWEWLQRFRHSDERLLVPLRSAATVEIRYPAALGTAAARAAWDEYLKGRLLRHSWWLIFNLVLSAITLLLAILPGPNVIGYWFAYRAVHHLLVLVGLWRVRSGRIATSFHASEALDVPLAEAERDGQPHPALGLDPRHLDEFLERPASPAPAGSVGPTREA
jgi:hypothetical protein